MTSRPEPCTLLAASDLLSSVQALVEAAFMAAGSLGKREEASALQQVLDIADARLSIVRSSKEHQQGFLCRISSLVIWVLLTSLT